MRKSNIWARNLRVIVVVIIIVAVGVGVCIATRPMPASKEKVVANFGERVDPPLIKKFGQFNSGLIFLSRIGKNIEQLTEVRADHLRSDLSIGKSNMGFTPMDGAIVSGTPDNLAYDWSTLDNYTRMLNDKNVLPYMCWCYTPKPFQWGLWGGDWRSGPSDNNLDEWKEMFREFASHFKDAGIRIGYHETYNEPDLYMFSTFSFPHFIEMYKCAVQGLKEGDPDAVVGGPSVADPKKEKNVNLFLDAIEQYDLPLDFFSFHAYWGDMSGIHYINQRFKENPRYGTTETHLNEFNVTPPSGEGCDSYNMGSRILEAINKLLDETDLTLVSWAQWLQTPYDIVGTVNLEGKKKAAFNAQVIYARMPVDRCRVETDNSNLGTMASTDGHRASVVVWNRSDQQHDILVDFENIPFASGTITVYRIDENHSHLSDLAVIDTQNVESTADLFWSGAVPPYGVVYIEIEDGTGISDATPVEIGNVIRKHHYYPNRGQSSYAFFNEKSWTAYLGMGAETSAYSLVGVEVEDLPSSLNVSFIPDGDIRNMDKNSVLGMRIDYRENNSYTKSVLFHGGIYDPKRDAEMPWGTERSADDVVEVGNLSDFDVTLGKYAPEDWNGRAIISFVMQDTGADTRAKVVVTGTEEV